MKTYFTTNLISSLKKHGQLHPTLPKASESKEALRRAVPCSLLYYTIQRHSSACFIKLLLAEALTDDLHEPRAEVGVSDACQGQGTLTKRQTTETNHAVLGSDVVYLIAP